MVAADAGHAEIVNDLIPVSADLDQPNAAGNTALMLAAANGHVDIVQALLSAGANVRLLNKQRENARALAAARNYQPVVALLDGATEKQGVMRSIWRYLSGLF